MIALAFSERTKSYYLYQKSLAHEKIEHLLVLKTVENDSKQLLSAKLNNAPPNFEFTIKVVAKFTKALGFIHFKNSKFIEFIILIQSFRYIHNIRRQVQADFGKQ